MSDSQQKSLSEKSPAKEAEKTSSANLPAKIAPSSVSQQKNTTNNNANSAQSQSNSSNQSSQNNAAEEKPTIQFTTENIGDWKSRQENPFAEQNRKRQAKKQAGDDRLRKSAPYIFAGGILILVVGLVVCIVMLIINIAKESGRVTDRDGEWQTPVISNDSSESVIEYTQALEKFYNRNPEASEKEKLETVSKVVQETLDKNSENTYDNQVKLAQMSFYATNGYYNQAIEAGQGINAGALPEVQRLGYYNMLMNSYYNIGDSENYNQYYAEVERLSQEINNR